MRTSARLLAVVLVAALPACAAATRTYNLRVEGMTCGQSCPLEVEEALESIPGVRSVSVDYPTQSAVIVVDADRELTTREMDLSFRNKGYFISSMEPAK
ncbi:MAG TPA: cation transporter [Candidatus Limnocylindrales bacterium]|nr:cation transporter [Candidatus Limnocylindrales bacterium]